MTPLQPPDEASEIQNEIAERAPTQNSDASRQIFQQKDRVRIIGGESDSDQAQRQIRRNQRKNTFKESLFKRSNLRKKSTVIIRKSIDPSMGASGNTTAKNEPARIGAPPETHADQLFLTDFDALRNFKAYFPYQNFTNVLKNTSTIMERTRRQTLQTIKQSIIHEKIQKTLHLPQPLLNKFKSAGRRAQIFAILTKSQQQNANHSKQDFLRRQSTIMKLSNRGNFSYLEENPDPSRERHENQRPDADREQESRPPEIEQKGSRADKGTLQIRIEPQAEQTQSAYTPRFTLQQEMEPEDANRLQVYDENRHRV